jgi:hypothetical protein
MSVFKHLKQQAHLVPRIQDNAKERAFEGVPLEIR